VPDAFLQQATTEETRRPTELDLRTCLDLLLLVREASTELKEATTWTPGIMYGQPPLPDEYAPGLE